MMRGIIMSAEEGFGPPLFNPGFKDLKPEFETRTLTI